MSRNRKLSKQEAFEVKAFIKDPKISNSWICENYNISRQLLYNIKNGISYSDMDEK